MGKIYLASAGVEYEGHTTISAHKTIEGANKAIREEARESIKPEELEESKTLQDHLCIYAPYGRYYLVEEVELKE